MYFLDSFFKLNKTPNDGTLLGRTSEEVFVVSSFHFHSIFDIHFIFVSSFRCCSSFVDVLHSHLLSNIIPHPSADYGRIFTTILYFQPSPSQSDLPYFHFELFRDLLTPIATVLSRRFLPTDVFNLMVLHRYFCLNLRLSRPLWELAVLP